MSKGEAWDRQQVNQFAWNEGYVKRILKTVEK